MGLDGLMDNDYTELSQAEQPTSQLTNLDLVGCALAQT